MLGFTNLRLIPTTTDRERVILPGARYPTIFWYAPVFFLAGPVPGAPNWQREAITILRKSSYSGWIASPRPDTLSESAASTGNMPVADLANWKAKFLKRAADKGRILFWLPKQAIHIRDHVYAQRSRFELGVLAERYASSKTLVVGIERGFPGEEFLRQMLEKKFVFKVRDNLRDLCRAALDKEMLAS